MNGIPETQDSVRINALEFFNELQSAFEKKNLVLFLDYDGTLSPIVELPDQVLECHPLGDSMFVIYCHYGFVSCNNIILFHLIFLKL